MSDSTSILQEFLRGGTSPRANDMTNQYNTALTPAEEYQYQRWIQLQSAVTGRDMSNDTFNYDMRGAFKGGAGASTDTGHFPDTYKKPNHPSFSTESQYSGKDGYTGGTWTQKGKQWVFTPSATNLEIHGTEGIKSYFERSDPGVQVNIPK